MKGFAGVIGRFLERFFHHHVTIIVILEKRGVNAVSFLIVAFWMYIVAIIA